MDHQICHVGNMLVNAYLIKTPKGVIAVDTGYSGTFEAYKQMAEKCGIALEEIVTVFLTHAHDDHAGFLNELIAETDADIFMHPEAVERLALGENVSDMRYTSKKAKRAARLLEKTGMIRHGFLPVTDTERFKIWDRQTQLFQNQGLDLTIIELNGHTADSIGLLTAEGVLFCGDAAMNGYPSKKHISIVLEDKDAYVASWDKMISSGAKKIYPGHGAVFPIDDLIKYRNDLNVIELQ